MNAPETTKAKRTDTVKCDIVVTTVKYAALNTDDMSVTSGEFTTTRPRFTAESAAKELKRQGIVGKVTAIERTAQRYEMPRDLFFEYATPVKDDSDAEEVGNNG